MRIRHVRDPIYGYIDFTARSTGDRAECFEEDLIEDPWLLRLNRISQLHGAWIRYPSARHTRYSHSLGVMHLAGEIARAVYGPFFFQHATSPRNELPPVEAVVEVFRLAGLLHDVGYGPFAHLFDSVVLKRFGHTHEDISEYLARVVLADKLAAIRQSPRGVFPAGLISTSLVAALVSAKAEQTASFKTPLERQCLRMKWIISGNLINADTLDYLMRDAYHCGVPEYRGVDYQRLTRTVCLRQAENEEGQQFDFDNKSMHAFVAYLTARQFMYHAVYFHEDVRALEFEQEELLRATMGLLEFRDPLASPDAIKEFFKLDETSVYSCAHHARSLSYEQHLLAAEVEQLVRGVNDRLLRWRYIVYDHPSSIELSRQFEDSAYRQVFDAKVTEGLQHLGRSEELRYDRAQSRVLPTVLGTELSSSTKHRFRNQLFKMLPRQLVLARVYAEAPLADEVVSEIRALMDEALDPKGD